MLLMLAERNRLCLIIPVWCCVVFKIPLLVQVWESAVNLAMSNRKERIGEVVCTVAQRLMQNERYEAAAELLQGIDDIQGAIQYVLLVLSWSRRTVCAEHAVPCWTAAAKGLRHIRGWPVGSLFATMDAHARLYWAVVC